MLVKMSTLYGKYHVAKFDGEDFPKRATMEFSAGEHGGVRVHAHIANVMNGQLTDANNTLKGMLMSTMMMGGEEQMALEDALAGGFASGAAYKVESGKVTLTAGSHTIELTPQ